MFTSSLARMEQRSRNMREMIQRLGIEPTREVIDGGRILRAAAQSCLFCRAGEECSEWLNAHAGPIEAAPAFCPNAVRFREMQCSA